MDEKGCFEDEEISGTLKAFAISLAQYAVKHPDALLDFEKANPTPNKSWKELHDILIIPEEAQRFSENLEKARGKIKWGILEENFRKWAEYGWVTSVPHFDMDFWNECPKSQLEADRYVLKGLKNVDFAELWSEIREESRNKPVFSEACKCFENRQYTACASLLISLIDGELISSRENNKNKNRKTGSTAGSRVVEEKEKSEFYGLKGYFNLEMINFKAYIDLLFERAGNFEKEPKRVNRNFLHHGMSKRKVLRKDCIKLFIAYRQTIRYC